MSAISPPDQRSKEHPPSTSSGSSAESYATGCSTVGVAAAASISSSVSSARRVNDKVEPDELMQRYERLLNEMRDIDVELSSSSRSWIKSNQGDGSVSNMDLLRRRISNDGKKKTKKKKDSNDQGAMDLSRPLIKIQNEKPGQRKIADTSFSPMILQMCLIALVALNFLLLYFFNDIHLWWTEYVLPSLLIERHEQETFDL